MINILVTIGPNSLNQKDIERFAATTNLFRLNGSHGNLNWHKEAISLIRSIQPSAFILMDIPGVKPRTNNLKEVEIIKGQEVTFANTPLADDGSSISLTKPLPIAEEKPKSFSVNDGQFLFKTTNYGKDYISGISQENFTLLPRKGINLPDSVYDEEQQANIYEKFLEQTADLEIDALGLSFVQTGALVDKIRKSLSDLVLISKIENSKGLKNCEEIASRSDAIMIDRGDLVAEIGYYKFYSAVETIASVSKFHGKPLIMATENLESMINRSLPSKSEVISLAHSANIGVDCFMLSEETALSLNKHTIVSWLSEYLENITIGSIVKNHNTTITRNNNIWAAAASLEDIPALVMSKSGRAVSTLISQRGNSDIFVITNNTKVVKIMQLFKNDIQVFKKDIYQPATIETIWETVEANKDDIFRDCEEIMALYVSKYVNSPSVNSLVILKKSDFH